jgi:hypothetical protein
MTPWQVSWFSDFVQIFCNLETLFPQVVRHVTTTRCSTFHMSSWIKPQYNSNIMNIIFWITKLYYLMHLQFKFEVWKTIQQNKKINKIYKKFKLSPNLSKAYQIMWECLTKNETKNLKKKINSPSAFVSTRGRDPSPSVRSGALTEEGIRPWMQAAAGSSSPSTP